MSISAERLREIVAELSARPGHEKVRALVYALLVDALGADSASIDFERPLPEVRGRVDALLGHTVFEFKRNLRTERIHFVRARRLIRDALRERGVSQRVDTLVAKLLG